MYMYMYMCRYRHTCNTEAAAHPTQRPEGRHSLKPVGYWARPARSRAWGAFRDACTQPNLPPGKDARGHGKPRFTSCKRACSNWSLSYRLTATSLTLQRASVLLSHKRRPHKRLAPAVVGHQCCLDILGTATKVARGACKCGWVGYQQSQSGWRLLC